MVEGAKRQKTPNEIALTILAGGADDRVPGWSRSRCCRSRSSASLLSAQVRRSAITVLVALLVCLIPTTIGGLLSAIGMAGMSRMMQANVIATSGRAVEAAGDVDVLLLDKTGTITLGNRQASSFIPAPGVTEAHWLTRRMLASLADETPEGRSIVTLAPRSNSIYASRRCAR
jgi:K+-transporting ATPase ATPase B chain